MRTKATSQNKPLLIVRIIKTPIHALCKAKDYYIKGINNFNTAYNRPMMVREGANRFTMPLLRSFSSTMLVNDDTGNQSGGQVTRYIKQNPANRSISLKFVPRSCSVRMGRIDEDRASSFRNDIIIFEQNSRIPRILGSAHDGSRF
ncbi:hypothetical protein R6Q57_001669 [Mikania cordata]